LLDADDDAFEKKNVVDDDARVRTSSPSAVNDENRESVRKP